MRFLSYTYKQLNTTNLWIKPPSHNILTEHAEKKDDKHWINFNEYIWLHVTRKMWHVMYKKYSEAHVIKSHPMCINLHAVTWDEYGRMGYTYKSPNKDVMPCPMILCITQYIAPLISHSRWCKTYNSHLNYPSYPKALFNSRTCVYLST